MTDLRPFRFGVVGITGTSRHAWVAKAQRAEALGYSTFLVEETMRIIFCLFEDVARAQAAVDALQARPAALRSEDIGIVAKSADGEVDFLETAEERELRRASTFGRVTGWLLGLAGAIVGAPFSIWQSTASGDLLAGDAALHHDAGFPDHVLRALGEHLHAGSAAVVALARDEDAVAAMAVLEHFGGTLHQGTLPPDVEAALLSGD